MVGEDDAQIPGDARAPLRGIAIGCLVGVPLSLGNVYMALKTGWWDTGQITATLIGFPLLRGAAKLRRSTVSTFDLNLVQVTACSVAGMPAVLGLFGAVPALSLSGQHLDPLLLACFGVALAFLGIWVAWRIQSRLFDVEKLPFPTGIAAAELIRQLESDRAESGRLGRVFLGSSAVATATTWLRDGPLRWVPTTSFPPFSIASSSFRELSIGFSWSPMLLGIGCLVGVRGALSLLLGSTIAWVAITPTLRVHEIVTSLAYDAVSQWLLWPGVGCMAGASVVSLLGSARLVSGALRGLSAGARAQTTTPLETGPRTSWRAGALLCLGALFVLSFAAASFHLDLVHTLLLLPVSFVLALVCARSAGHTDVAPVGTIGQLTQVSYGALGDRSVTTNVGAGQISAGLGVEVVNALWSWRAGHILGARRDTQILAQVVGALLGALFALPIYTLIFGSYTPGSAEFPAPTAIQWKAVADLVAGGASMPEGAAVAGGAAFALGMALDAGRRTSMGRILPDASALGVGFLVPAQFAVTIFVGAAVVALLRRRLHLDDRVINVAGSGAIAFEAVTGVALSFWAAR